MKVLLSTKQIIQVLETKKYKIFEGGEYNLNLVGIRSDNRVPNKFDDEFHVFWESNIGKWNHCKFACTTDPGTYWLNNPPDVMGVVGTAILKPGQYRGAYQIGLHRTYEALVQTGGQVTILRDTDKDNELDFDSKIEQTGFLGINIHRASPYNQTITVDNWSAGCQVIANPSDFELLMTIARLSRRKYGNLFTYTLLVEADFTVPYESNR